MKNFWTGEKCEYCKGILQEQHIESCQKVGKKYIVLQKVPVGICRDCGMKYFSANVLKSFHEFSNRSTRAKKQMTVPVFSFSS